MHVQIPCLRVGSRGRAPLASRQPRSSRNRSSIPRARDPGQFDGLYPRDHVGRDRCHQALEALELRLDGVHLFNELLPRCQPLIELPCIINDLPIISHYR